jgi:hypothetical protein
MGYFLKKLNSPRYSRSFIFVNKKGNPIHKDKGACIKNYPFSQYPVILEKQ